MKELEYRVESLQRRVELLEQENEKLHRDILNLDKRTSLESTSLANILFGGSARVGLTAKDIKDQFEELYDFLKVERKGAETTEIKSHLVKVKK